MRKNVKATDLWVMACLLFSLGAADAAVTEAWVRRYNAPANSDDRAQAMAVDNSGNVVVTGDSYNSGGNADHYTAKYAATNGALLWERRNNGGTGDDFARAVAVDGSDNVMVTGDAWYGSSADYSTLKYAMADGVPLWEQGYNGPANSDDYAAAVAVDGNGNVIVTGNSYNISGNANYYTAKYAGANGVLLWERRYSGLTNGDHFATALVLDGSGNVLVTGQSWNGTNADYYTAKYGAANGALVWEQRFNGSANRNDLAQAVSVDGNGNVVVTGSSHNGTNYDCYTAKYAAATGTLLWEQRYNSPANRDDFAQAVGVDGSGNVIVTGYSNNETNSDYYTAKYAVGSGALLWERRYNGPANGDDEAVALAVDGSGSVYVTGSSVGINGNSVYATVEYDLSGNELWVARYDGGTLSDPDNYASAIALDTARNIYVTGSSGGDFATIKYVQTVVAGPPIITSQPASRIVHPGTNVSLSVGVFGTAPFTYRWQRNGTNLTDGGRVNGAASSVLTITNAIENDSGLYSVVVTNGFGTATSSNALLMVTVLDHFSWAPVPSPQLVNEPFAVTIEARDSSNRVAINYAGPAALSASAPDSGVSKSILASTNHSDIGAYFANSTLGYSFTPNRNITITAVGHYFGTKVSLWTDDGVLLLEQLVSSVPGTWVETPLATPILLAAGTRYRVAIHAGGIIYWRNDGAPTFPDGTIDESFFSFGNTFPTESDSVRWWFVDLRYTASAPVAMLPTNSGNFTNGIWSGHITVLNSATNLSLRAEDVTGRAGLGQPIQVVPSGQPPIILTQPASQTVVTGVTVNLSVSVYAVTPLSWQWRFNGSNLPGATNSSLTLAALNTSHSGDYSVTVTNLFGSTTSSNAAITVLEVPPFFDDFEPGIDQRQWSAFSPTVLATNFGGSVSGVNALWFGGTGSRFAQTRPINTTSGGVVDFYLVLSDGENFFWEVVDLPFEGVVLEYSITGGANWIEFGRYDASTFYDWKHLVVNIPTPARTASTQFRWRQLSNTGANSDHWALDDVAVITGPQTGPPISFVWSNIPSPQITNLPFLATIQMRNLASQLMTSFNGTVGLSGVAGGSVPIIPAVSGNFTNGTWSGLITVLTPATNLVLRADDGAGINGDSNPFQVIRSNQPPIIVTYPTSQTVPAGSNVVLSVGVIGNAPIRYQWVRNGLVIENGGHISGATNSTLAISNCVESDSGLYSVFVGNPFGSGISASGSLTVRAVHHFTWAFISSPVSTLQPLIVTIRARDFTNGVVTTFNGTVTFDASISGSGTPVPVSPSVSGAFSNGVWRGGLSMSQLASNVVLRADDGFGAVGISAPFDIARVAAFTLHPASQDVLPGTNVTLSAAAIGTGPVRYQWRFSGTNIPNATNASYSFTGANLTNHHGNFSVAATDDLSTTASSNAFIYVLIKPTILTHITSQTVLEGGTARFSLVATGAPPLGYRWIRNNGLLPGVSTSTPLLVITNVQASGSIRIGVTNRASPAGVYSPGPNSANNVTLTMLPDFDRDGISDAWEAQYGFNTNNAADALLDSDGDGLSNHAEYIAGTNPTDRFSYLKIDSVEAVGSGHDWLLVGFSAVSNRTYTLQYRDAIETAGWANLLDFASAPTNRVVTLTNAMPPASATRYYRLVTPRQGGE